MSGSPQRCRRCRAIVIGGGIGGLTTAIALRRIGIEVTVYERAPELNDVGAGITLWSNATRVLQSLGLDALVASGRRFPSADLLLPSGRLLARSSPALAVERQLHAPT
ncbi:MAG: FAD-dependent oxidoreductase, partial [Acidobacteriota bacterium]|nr:FAD-dependent oxidoreductase [Acidobacteriota bacterium]